MAMDYSSENPHSQLAKLRAEGPHIERLTEAATMWRTARQRIQAARDDLSTRTDVLEATWRDDAGREFAARVEESIVSLAAWHERIEKSGVAGQINALQLTYPNCVAGVQAVCHRFQMALQAQQAGGGAVDSATLERQYSMEAARYTNHVADRIGQVSTAMGALEGGSPGATASEGGHGGSAGAGDAPGGTAVGEQPPPTEGPAPEGAKGQQNPAQAQQGGGQDPLQQGLAAAQQAGQLAQQSGGAGGSPPNTDASLLDPARSASVDPNGLPGLAGGVGTSVGGTGGVGGGAGGGLTPVTQPMNPGASPALGGAPPMLPAATTSGATTAGAGVGGMAPMMAPLAARGGPGAARGVNPGDAEHAGRSRPRDGRSPAVAGVPAALRGRSGQPTSAAPVPARPRAEPANDNGEVLDEELWHVAGHDHPRADSKGTLRSIR